MRGTLRSPFDPCSRLPRWTRSSVLWVALLWSVATACGDDGATPLPDGATADDVDPGAPRDAASGGVGDAGSVVDTGSSSGSDAGGGASDDASAPDAAFAPCQRPQIGCIGPCRVYFFTASAGRDNVLAIQFVNELGAPMRATDVAIVAGGSPYVRLSESWFDYMDRAGEGTWVASPDGLGFDTVGTPIPIGVGESFTVDVFFAEHESTGPQCPGGDGRACAELVVSFDDCSGGAVERRIPVQI